MTLGNSKGRRTEIVANPEANGIARTDNKMGTPPSKSLTYLFQFLNVQLDGPHPSRQPVQSATQGHEIMAKHLPSSSYRCRIFGTTITCAPL